jgi:murein DD-endopeptidase MepM/ murein hydrolase activator NlpD
MRNRAALFLLLAAVPAAPMAPAAAQARPMAAAGAPMPRAPQLPLIPDPSGWGVHILALARGPDGTIWAGTYDEGIFVLRPGAAAWENLRASREEGTISSDFVHAFAFHGRDVWYGTIGDGWGLSTDGGRTWRNWGGRQLGKRWRYVAPNGIVVRRDTVFIATADGIRWTADRGETWGAITDSMPGGLSSRYVLTMAPARDGGLLVATLRGFGQWRGGRYRPFVPSPATPLGPRVRAILPITATLAVAPALLGSESCIGSLRPERRARREPARWECMALFARAGGAAIRQLADCDGVLCAGATSVGALYAGRMGLTLQPRAGSTARSRDVYAALPPAPNQPGDTIFGTACGILGQQPQSCLEQGDTVGVRAPAEPRRPWLGRPIARTDNPYNDQTYRWGSTMGGAISVQHQGIDINEPGGTGVLAIDGGAVVHAGPAEAGAQTVVIRHDSMLTTPEGRFFLFSTYYHNSALLVRAGQRVARGQVISRVGSTGRATNDHLHLEVHASPVDSVALIVDPEVQYPPFTRNPELWIEPMPGTGVVAGQVWDSQGRPVPMARIYGLVKPEPQETPHSYAETYGEHARPDPTYGEHFAVTDVPAGEYVLGTTIEGRRVFRRIQVEAGKVTWVEFR